MLARFIAAVHPPPSGDGVVVALINARQSVQASATFLNLEKLDQLHRALQALIQRVRAIDSLPVHATTTPDLRPLNATYRLFIEGAGNAYPAATRQKLQALKGLALAHALATNCPLAPTFADSWLTLGRAATKKGRTAEIWRQFAEQIDLTAVLNVHLPADAPQSIEVFVTTLRTLLDASLPDLNLDSGKNEDVAAPPGGPPKSEQIQSIDEDHSEGIESVLTDAKSRNHSLVRWQWARAKNASPLDACGFESGWDHLHRDELRIVTKRLAADLRSEAEREARLACLVLLALLFGLPPKLALTVPLQANGDLWLSLGDGCGYWSLEQVIERHPPPDDIAALGYNPRSSIRLPLAKVVSAFLLRLEASDRAETVGDLLFPEGSDGVSTEVEEYLKEIAPDTTHQPHPSRVTYSLGRLLLQITGQDTVAALGSLDLVLAGAEQLNYLCIHESKIIDAIFKANRFLGLGDSVEINDSEWVGSPLRPRLEVVSDGWASLCADSKKLTDRATPNLGIDNFLDIFNEQTHLDLAAFDFAAAHRGTQITRLTFAQLYSAKEMIVVNDKASDEFSAWRPLPRYPLLGKILDGRLANLRCAARRLEKSDRRMAKRIEEICDGKLPNAPMFFVINHGKRGYKISLLRTKDIRPVVKKYFGVINAGRHHWLSIFVERSVERPLQRVLMGHARKAFVPHGAGTGLAIRSSCDVLGKRMQAIAASLGMIAPPALANARPYEIELGAFVSNNTRTLDNEFVTEYLKEQNLYRYKAKECLESPPVDRHSTSAYGLVAGLRIIVSTGKALPDPWTCVFISLILFNGQVFDTALRGVWGAVMRNRMLRIGHAYVIESQLDHSAVPVIGVTITNLFLHAARQADPNPPDYRFSVQSLATWLRKAAPSSRWESNDEMVLGQLLAAAQRWLRCEISPHVYTTSSPCFQAATISTTSIARIAYGRPAIPKEPVRRSKSSPGQFDMHFKALSQMLHHHADTDRQVGENQNRRNQIAAELNSKYSEGVPPLIADDAEWLTDEVTVSPRQTRVLDVASVASYHSKLLPAFSALDVGTSFRELDADDWFRLFELVEADHRGEQLEQRRSIFRRFSRYWIRAGASVPRGIFVDPGAINPTEQVSRASAVYITKSECERASEYLNEVFRAEPLCALKASAKLKLLVNAPLRNGEASRIQNRDLEDAVPAVHITSSGFSHLKSHSSRRQILIDDELKQALASLREEVLKLLGHQRFILLWDDDSRMHDDVHRIDDAIDDALWVETGEQAVRKHAFRGSCVARTIYPEVERVVQELAAGSELIHGCKTDVEHQILRVPRAALKAGHFKCMSTLQYYFSVWPIALYDELSNSLAGLSPGDQLAKHAKWEAPAMRKALSRLRTSTDGSRPSEWSIFRKRLSGLGELPSMESLLVEEGPSVSKVKGGVGGSSLRKDDYRELLYVALRMVRFEPGTALAQSGVSGDRLSELEQIVSAAKLPAAVEADSHANCNWYRKQLCAPHRRGLLEALQLCHNASQLAVISSAMAPSIFVFDGPGSPTLKSVIQGLLTVTPRSLTVSILPAKTCSPGLAQELAAMPRKVLIKPSSKRFATGYRIGLTAVDATERGPRADGDTTQLFRLACQARLAILLSPKTGETHA